MSSKSPLESKPNNILADLRAAITSATEEEKQQLAKDLGLSRATQPATKRRPMAQTNADVAQMARMSGGASHGVDFVPAPPDWVVQHGGGMSGETKKIKTLVQGQEREVEEFEPYGGERAYENNWAVEIYRDRWLNNFSPLPDTSAYNRERVRAGTFDANPLNAQMQEADQFAAIAEE